MAQHLPILVAGAGIGGLSVAIALAQSGFYVQLLEQADHFSEVGAGIQLGPNAARILDQWGVSHHFQAQSVTPERISLFDGLSGENLAHVPLGDFARQRYHAPYYVQHRADLQSALLKVAKDEPNITITTGFKAQSFQQSANEVILFSEDRRKIEGEALIGADGLWSVVRQKMHGVKPSPIGKTSWRTVVPSEKVPDFFKRKETMLWMAPRTHLVHYPVMGGKAINVIAIVDDKNIDIGWNIKADGKEILQAFKGWHNMSNFIASLEGWHKWSLFAIPSLKKWSQGRVTLLGDAAHPPVPFLAQGGVMAIEDAAVLANQLVMTQKDYAKAFLGYESQRISRVQKVMTQSAKMGEIYHMSNPARWVRNTVLKQSKPENLLKKYDWLYGFEAVKASAPA